jgi:hypothetical protein
MIEMTSENNIEQLLKTEYNRHYSEFLRQRITKIGNLSSSAKELCLANGWKLTFDFDDIDEVVVILPLKCFDQIDEENKLKEVLTKINTGWSPI